jgi:hypothetical protein
MIPRPPTRSTAMHTPPYRRRTPAVNGLAREGKIGRLLFFGTTATTGPWSLRAWRRVSA